MGIFEILNDYIEATTINSKSLTPDEIIEKRNEFFNYIDMIYNGEFTWQIMKEGKILYSSNV
jgi:hypothetical protein